MSAWTTPADARATLKKRWARGDLLTALANGMPVVPQAVPIRGPGPREVAADFGRVQDWVRGWENAAGFRVDHGAVGGRLVGTNRIPVKAWVDDEDRLWRLVEATADVAAWRQVATFTDQHCPALSAWVRAHPRDAVAAAGIWERAVGVVTWIRAHAGPGVYVRHIDVPGVDTKFVETNRTTLAAMLDELLPPERIDRGRPRTDLPGRYGLAAKPSYLRLRRLDETPLIPGWGPPGVAPAELTLRVGDLAGLDVPASSFLVVENETTYLALPPLPGVVAAFGGGYAASRLQAVPWLAERTVRYWGDLDTHGFAILNGLRAYLPDVRSVLMDRATFQAHEPHWSTDATPHTGRLDRLDEHEQLLYQDLVESRYGDRVRLEQERIRFGHAKRCLVAESVAVHEKVNSEATAQQSTRQAVATHSPSHPARQGLSQRSDRDDVDEVFEPSKVVSVAGVEGRIVRVRGRCDH